jgi:hypothetical protein
VARHEYLLIRRLATLLRTRVSKSGHLLQAVHQESRGNCLPPSAGCGPACLEAQDLVALTERYMPTAKVERKPVKPRPLVVLKRSARRPRAVQPALLLEVG